MTQQGSTRPGEDTAAAPGSDSAPRAGIATQAEVAPEVTPEVTVEAAPEVTVEAAPEATPVVTTDPRATLEQAEAVLFQGNLARALELLGQATAALTRDAARPGLLARATWLAGVLALMDGDTRAFAQRTRQAVALMDELGLEAQAQTARLARDELVERAGDPGRLRREGLAGLRHVAERHCARLLDLAARQADVRDAGWQVIARERKLWPAMLGVLQQALGQSPPLVRVVRAFGLSDVEATLVVVLWALSTSEALASRAAAIAGVPGPGIPAGFLVDLAIGDPARRQEALWALRPQGTLRRHHLVQAVDDGRAAGDAAGQRGHGGDTGQDGEPGQRSELDQPRTPADPRCERMRLDPDASAALQGIWRPPPHSGQAVRVRGLGTAHVPLEPLLQPALTQLVCLLQDPPVHIGLVGRDGAGKRTLVAAATAALGCSAIELHTDAAPRDPAALRTLIARCCRDARLHRALLYVAVDGAGAAEALAQVLEEPRLRPDLLVFGVPGRASGPAPGGDAGDGSGGVFERAAGSEGHVPPRLRALWPDMVEVTLPVLDLPAQPAVWSSMLARLGARAPEAAAIEAHACRPGLVIGDIARAAAMAAAHAHARAAAPASRNEVPGELPGDDDHVHDGSAGPWAPSAEALGAALAEHLRAALDRVAERLWPVDDGMYRSRHRAGHRQVAVAALDGDWRALVDTVRGGQQVMDAWGLSVRQTGFPAPQVVRVAGGSHNAAVAHARAVALALCVPLYRADLGYLAAMPEDDAVARLHRVLAAAERCGAVLLLTPLSTLSISRLAQRALADALGSALELLEAVVLLHDPAESGAGRTRLPVALESRIDRTIILAGETAPAAPGA